MRDELYINGVKVDLGKTNIDLTYKSNLLSDISKIVSNNSYTIKLPKTAKNLALIECVHIPSAVSKFPYLKHAGTLIRDGIEIVKNANVVLLEINESIEIALSWGNVINFANVVNNGKKLTDLSYGTTENVDWAVWKKLSSQTSRFPRVYYGYNSGDTNVWYHPVMKVSEIMDKIQSDNKVTFEIPNDKLEVMNKMIIPLLTKNDSQELYDKYPINLALESIRWPTPISMVAGVSYVGLNIKFSGDDTQVKYGNIATSYYKDEYDIGEANIIGYKFAYNHEFIKIKGNTAFSFTMLIPPISAHLQIILDGTIVGSIEPSSFIVNGNQATVSFVFNHSLAVNEGQILIFTLFTGLFLKDVKMFPLNNLSISISKIGEVLFGEKFPFVPNLPDMKQIEFLKAITSMLGLFAIPGESNTIKFIPFDNLKDNVSKAVDWTGKVIKAYRQSVPRSMKYTLDNTAQNNRFLYKEDDSVKGNYDGNLKIEDSTLDFERDAIKLPFSACDTKDKAAYIPIYSYNGSGELEYKKSNPRILLLKEINPFHILYGVFKGLEWETLLNNNYSTYKGMVNEAKVLTEHVRLNSIELRDLEMDVPVYLGQYGCYLAIIEIKTKENDVCECRLLKLEV